MTLQVDLRKFVHVFATFLRSLIAALLSFYFTRVRTAKCGNYDAIQIGHGAAILHILHT